LAQELERELCAMMWRGDCARCEQGSKLGYSRTRGEFWCQACHDRFDDDASMRSQSPEPPPRWDGGQWGLEPSFDDIQAYVEQDGLLRQFFDIEGELLEVVSDPSHYMFQGVGGNIWNSSLGFAPFLNRTLPAADKLVLELGAGCGVPGLHLARRRPDTKVILSDVPHLLPLLRFNAREISNAEVVPLTWGNMSHMRPLMDREVDTIVASDIVFDPDFYDVLLETLRLLACGDALSPRSSGPARILLALAMRKPDAPLFFEVAEKHAFRMAPVFETQVDVCSSVTKVFACHFEGPAPRVPEGPDLRRALAGTKRTRRGSGSTASTSASSPMSGPMHLSSPKSSASSPISEPLNLPAPMEL